MDLLKIIVIKNVNVRYLKFCFTVRGGLRRYNKLRIKTERLTKDEYNCFKTYIASVEKEVLK